MAENENRERVPIPNWWDVHIKELEEFQKVLLNRLKELGDKEYEKLYNDKPKKLVTIDCMVCGEEFQGEEPLMCCSGRDCGCRGMPVDPVICSEECYNKLPFKVGKKNP